jgi:hypothetical protein
MTKSKSLEYLCIQICNVEDATIFEFALDFDRSKSEQNKHRVKTGNQNEHYTKMKNQNKHQDGKSKQTHYDKIKQQRTKKSPRRKFKRNLKNICKSLN